MKINKNYFKPITFFIVLGGVGNESHNFIVNNIFDYLWPILCLNIVLKATPK